MSRAFATVASGEATHPGCLAGVLGAVLLVVLGPPTALVRAWRRRRRGDDVRLQRLAAEAGPGELVRLGLELDLPRALEIEWRWRLTDAVVRVGEALRRPDDVYHLIWRPATEPEAVALPLGPRLEALGERFLLLLGHPPAAGRTAVWFALGGDRALGEVVDPATCDPEAEDGPEGLVARAHPRWAAASVWLGEGPSARYRLELFVPAAEAEAVARLLARLEPAHSTSAGSSATDREPG